MNNLGLYSGWYAQLRQYSDLLDEVLIELASGQTSRTATQRQKLVDLFRQLAQSGKEDPRSEPLKVWIRRQVSIKADQWRDLAESLQSAPEDKKLRSQLEELAREIDLRRTEVLLSMRGR